MTEDDDKRNALEDYREWAENRYNPGYWTGGRVPPQVRNLWSTRDRKWIGSVLMAVSVLWTGYQLSGLTKEDVDVILIYAFLINLPMFAIGWMLVFNLPRSRRSPNRD